MFKLKQAILIREDSFVDIVIISVYNDSMMFHTAEVFISKFLDLSWAKLAKQISTKINANLKC